MINRLSLRNVVTIVICLVTATIFTSCKKETNKAEESTLVGKWMFVDRDGVTLEITENKIMLLPVVPNPTPTETRTYSWISSDTIEITQQGWGVYITRNKVIFHTPDRVTIKGWFMRNNEVDAPIFADVTIKRIADGNENSYCVNTVKNLPTIITLSESEMNVIKYLFNHNQLDYTKYQFTQFQEDELGYRHIKCYQFANNLIVFTNDAIFHFDKNDNYKYLSGDLINTINLNTKSSMQQDKVVKKFVNEIMRDDFYKENAEIMNGCFDIEFGYYDLNAGISYVNEKYTKAWKIKSTNKDYPFAYINDENSEIIYYDNGIRF